MQNNTKLQTRTFNEIPFTIPPRYNGIKLLGAGSYGTVLLATDNKTNQKVAIKKLNAVEDIIDAKRLLREIRILRLMKHENIVKLTGCVYDNQSNEHDLFGTVYLI